MLSRHVTVRLLLSMLSFSHLERRLSACPRGGDFSTAKYSPRASESRYCTLRDLKTRGLAGKSGLQNSRSGSAVFGKHISTSLSSVLSATPPHLSNTPPPSSSFQVELLFVPPSGFDRDCSHCPLPPSTQGTTG